MFKDTIKHVELAITLGDYKPDDIFCFKCENCCYRVHGHSLERFLKKLKKRGVLHKPTFARLARQNHNIKNEDGSFKS